MRDEVSEAEEQSVGAGLKRFDLVVVGAGVAGLNALYAATEYVPKAAKVLLIDQKPKAGGMWNTAYDYVRLHQPHPMFTVGDMRWNWNKPRDYLAKRDEVRDHLASALKPVGEAVDLNLAFEHTVTAVDEIRDGNANRAQVTYRANDPLAEPQTVLAERVIHAPGLNYKTAEPLALTSRQVHSIIPQDLHATLTDHPGAPVIVVGGGKTGMDTILAALSDAPKRKVSLINGAGTSFVNRTKYIPTGIKRWTSGELFSRLFRDLALSFDGDNEDQTLAHIRVVYTTDPATDNRAFLYGLQSEAELSAIKSGLSATHAGYLADVIDGPEGCRMLLRDGTSLAVEAGSIVVNCGGSFFRSSEFAEPRACLSPKKTILSINPREGVHFLSSVAAFFLTHLLFRDDLAGRGFYRLDHESLFRQDRNAWVGASAAQAYLNQVLAVQTLPIMLLNRCGLDLDRWYPFPRRMAGLLRMKATAAQDIAHCRAALDRIGERFGIVAGPIE